MRSAWFVAGAAAGAYGVVKIRRIAEAFTPDGMRDRIGAAFVGARMLREEVAHGQAEAEIRLRERYGGAHAGPPELGRAPSTPSPETAPIEKGHELS